MTLGGNEGQKTLAQNFAPSLQFRSGAQRTGHVLAVSGCAGFCFCLHR